MNARPPTTSHLRLKRARDTLLRLGVDPKTPTDQVYAALSTTSSGGYASLLGSSYKCDLGENEGWMTAVQYLAPHKDAGVDHLNVCPYASPGCASTCITSTGQMVYSTHVEARVKRTLRWFLFPERTAQAFNGETLMHMGKAYARGYRPAVRMNGTSDWPFWTERHGIDLDLSVRRYDYTKRSPSEPLVAAHRRGWHMTYSLSEQPLSMAYAKQWQRHGVNVALVVSGPLGSTRTIAKQVAAILVERGELAGRPVIDGDAHDLRFLDPAVGGWIVLAAKGGKAKRDKTGFVVRFDPDALVKPCWAATSALLSSFDLDRFLED